ncbi:hypothetical protein JCM10450v2_004429 [Rhodotorula kratochvilovae]
MAESITSMVERILQHLPDGANPWTLIRLAFTAQVRPTLPNSFKAQLYTCSALIAATTLVLILCMAAKWRQGSYWLLRTHRGTGGTYLVVHYANAWSTMAILFLGILQGYIVQTTRYTSDVLHLDSSGRPSRAFYSQAWFINGGAILVPCVSAVAVALLAWQAHTRFVDAMSRFVFIDTALAAAESATGTFDTSLFQSGYGLSLAVAFTSSLSSFGKYAYFIMSALLEAILILTAVFHLRELRNTMHDLRGRAHQSEEARTQEEMIEKGYKGLHHITYSIVACCTAVNILFAYVAIAGRKVIYEKAYSEVASLLPLWLFSLLGLPLSLLFLRRILTSAPPRTSPALADEEVASFAIPVGVHNHSNPSTLADKKASTPGEEYAMTSLGSLASQQRVHKSEEYGSLRQDSPTLSAGSGAHLVSTPAGDGSAHFVAPPIGEQPFFASYETRAQMSAEDGAQGGGKWGSKKRIGSRK